jgi:hypothetical protein
MTSSHLVMARFGSLPQQKETDIMLHDNQDHDIPFADHDDWTECGIDDPDYNEPELWPEWTDADRWEPSQDDVEWLNHLEEMRQASEWLDRMEAMHPRIDDDDIRSCGLPVG